MANTLVNLFGAIGLDSTLQAIRDRLPGSLGKKANSASLSVTLSSDGESVSVSNFPATQPVSGTVTANTGLTQPVTDTQLRAADVKVSLDGEQVAISNFPASQAVTGTFWQTTQPVSGTVTANTGLTQPLTDTQLRASSLPLPSGAATSAKQDTIVSAIGSPFQAGGSIGNTQFGATQSGTWNVGVNNFPSSYAVTGTFWQATQPVSAASLPLPSGAATDSTVQALNALAQQMRDLNDSILYYTSAILEKMPRVTGADQAVVAIESGSVGIAANQTIGTVSNINSVGGKYVPGDTLGMAGTAHIYQHITVA